MMTRSYSTLLSTIILIFGLSRQRQFELRGRIKSSGWAIDDSGRFYVDILKGIMGGNVNYLLETNNGYKPSWRD